MADIKVLSCDKIPFDYNAIASATMKALNQSGSVSVELSIVDEEFIKKTNLEFRGIDKVTDVLSFPSLDGIRYKNVDVCDFPLDLDESGRVFLGSIIICDKRAKEQALEFGHSENREFCYLFCHGLLHLFGYDHVVDSDDIEMRALANKVLKLAKVDNL